MRVPKRAPGQRLLHGGYAELLRTVVDTPTTWHRLSFENNIERLTAQRTLASFEHLGLAHVARFARIKCGRRTQLTAVYEFGPGERAPWPGKGCPRQRAVGKVPIELLTFAHAIKALTARSLHGKELHEATGLSPRTCQRLLKRMHELRLIHIESYITRSIGGLGYPRYRFGIDKEDLPKPPRMPLKDLWTFHNRKRAKQKAQAREAAARRAARLQELASNASIFHLAQQCA